MSEAIIVGAGPGGCVAAVALARRGWGVTLIEQHQFPREKVCGECLSALGIEVLGRLGLVDEIRACRPVVLKRTVLHGQHRDSVSIALPREMWGLSRWALDDALLTAARGHGVRVLQPARCEGIRSGKRPSVTVRELLGNTTITLVADWVVLADGKAGLLPRRPPATGDLGIKAHIREVDGPRDAIELFGLPGNYGGMAPIEGERWNAAFSVPSNRLKMFGGDVERLMGQMMRENPVLACRLRGASKVGEWHVSPLPRFGVSTDWPAGIVPIGNAAAALEPIGGEGMGLAMRSAEMAADALSDTDQTSRNVDVMQLQAQFRHLWRTRRAACRALAMLMSSARLADMAITVVGASESTAMGAMHLMGKSERQVAEWKTS